MTYNNKNKILIIIKQINNKYNKKNKMKINKSKQISKKMK